MDEKDERWRDLAELLGLPPEKQAGAPKPAAAPARAEEKMARASEPERVEPPPMPPSTWESGRLETIPEEGVQIQESDFERPEDATIVDEASLIDETPAQDEAPASEEEPSAESEDRRGGKRRRRRGRRRGKEDRGDRDRDKPAGRGEDQHPRRESQEDDFEAAEEEEAEESPQQTPLSVEDTDFSNWNVPSWQEIVDSLYRPDR